MKKIGRLHILTDTILQNRFSHLQLTELAVAGGADTIQYRQKTGKTKEMIHEAEGMRITCREAGIPFVVNDRMDVALASQADGVHLGQEDFPIPLARKTFGLGAIIGGSACTLEEARKCVQEGADYIGFGPVFPTKSKDDAGPVSGLILLEKVVKEFSIPIIAIGGITESNVRQVMEKGAYGIAVISAVCCQEDPKKATRVLRKLLDRGLS